MTIEIERGVSISLLKSLLRLDAITGRLFWRDRPIDLFSGARAERECKRWNRRYAGREAFTAIDTHGYRHGSIMGKLFLAHRVVFALSECRWPSEDVDHKNGNKQDNRPMNLREASKSLNSRNRSKQGNNRSGVIGVCFETRKKKWLVQIGSGSGQVKIGLFSCFGGAVKARIKAENDLGYPMREARPGWDAWGNEIGKFGGEA